MLKEFHYIINPVWFLGRYQKKLTELCIWKLQRISENNDNLKKNKIEYIIVYLIIIYLNKAANSKTGKFKKVQLYFTKTIIKLFLFFLLIMTLIESYNNYYAIFP